MIRTLIALVPGHARRTLAGYVALTIVSVLLRAASAVLVVPLVAALVEGDSRTALWVLALLTGSTLVGWVVDSAASRRGFDLGFDVLDTAQHGISDRLTRIRMSWFTADRVADARASIAATGPDLVGLIVNLVTPIIGAVLLPPAIALALLWVSPPLALAALAGVPPVLGALWLAGRATRRADAAAEAANTALTERLVEFGRTQPVLRASRRAAPARSQVAEALAGQHAATMRLVLMQAPGQLLFALASQLALVLLAGTATVLVLRGELSTGAAVGLIVVIVRYLEPMTALATFAPALETTRLALARIRAVLDAPLAPSGPDDARFGAPPVIELRGIGVRHGDHPPVIDGLDLTLQPGTTTAIVGPSGSGKTTVLSLIAGLLQPTRGRVLLDGRDVAGLTAEAHRDAVSVVFQHPYLFEGTLRENVLVGDPGDSGAGRRRRIPGPGGRDHRTVAGGRRGRRGRGRGQALRRRTPAGEHRPRPAQAGAGAAGRRGDQRPRPRERAGRGRRADPGPPAPHPGDRGSPAVEHPDRRPGAVPGGRRHRRGRHRRGAAGRRWTVRRVLGAPATGSRLAARRGRPRVSTAPAFVNSGERRGDPGASPG